MKRLFASTACLAIATALLAAPAVAQAPASPAQPAPAAAAPAAPAASPATPAAAPTTAPAGATPAPMAHMHAAGSHAMTHTQRVERLQTALNANGAKLVVDGKMGPKTSAALTAFQQAHGLKVTGRIDKETMAALRKQS
jgi:peptidoglycan hydrolase-like protein with peptidoglycan-binding domain